MLSCPACGEDLAVEIGPGSLRCQHAEPAAADPQFQADAYFIARDLDMANQREFVFPRVGGPDYFRLTRTPVRIEEAA